MVDIFILNCGMVFVNRKMIIRTLRKYSTLAKDTFYVTTPIYYVNAAPHLGHLYSSVLADAVVRWNYLRNANQKYKFATGTDEHGIKIQQAAEALKTDLKNYCSTLSSKYEDLSKRFAVHYTDFIRTTDEKHQEAVINFWRTIDGNGFIYASKYSGWYCVPDETFLTQSQLKNVVINGKSELVSADSGHPVEWVEEQNYMFRLSAFQEQLMYWLSKNENVVKPKKFQKQLMHLISSESLRDVSISRPSSRVHWGVKVPGDDNQTVYVWLDALVNYLTAAGYPKCSESHFKNVWPPDVHVIGKDILKFHGVYWPAFLMAANLEPPQSIFCHSHWTVDDEKMSKSKGNVICPFNRSELYTSDGLRYFLLREGVAHSDGNYSDTKVIRILNSELADTLGNLLSRCTGSALNPHQIFPEIKRESLRELTTMDVTHNLMESVKVLPDVCSLFYNENNFYKAVDAIILTLHKANLFFETLKPWELKKSPDGSNNLDAVLHLTLETLRICGTLLQPLVPNISKMLLDKMGIAENERCFENLAKFSWEDENFRCRHLSSENAILFRRILQEGKRISLRSA